MITGRMAPTAGSTSVGCVHCAPIRGRRTTERMLRSPGHPFCRCCYDEESLLMTWWEHVQALATAHDRCTWHIDVKGAQSGAIRTFRTRPPLLRSWPNLHPGLKALELVLARHEAFHSNRLPLSDPAGGLGADEELPFASSGPNTLYPGIATGLKTL